MHIAWKTLFWAQFKPFLAQKPQNKIFPKNVV